jgi:hypothetical protein
MIFAQLSGLSFHICSTILCTSIIIIFFSSFFTWGSHNHFIKIKYTTRGPIGRNICYGSLLRSSPYNNNMFYLWNVGKHDHLFAKRAQANSNNKLVSKRCMLVATISTNPTSSNRKIVRALKVHHSNVSNALNRPITSSNVDLVLWLLTFR